MNLHKVRKNFILVFPYGFPEADRYRGGAGYVVDLDAPLEDLWCKDQLFKLESAPEAKEASAIVHPIAVRQIRAAIAEGVKSKPANDPDKVPVGAGVGSGESSGDSGSLDSLEVSRPVPKRKVG